MKHVLILLLITIGFLSFIPVFNMNKSRENNKYRCLKFLVNTAFVWTILIFVERLSLNMNVVYYAHILGYPLKFLLASFMVCTIFNYVERPMPKMVLGILGTIFVLELVVALTNNQTMYLLEATTSSITSFSDLYHASNGTLFIVHLGITYITLFIGVSYLFYFLAKHREVRQYKLVTQTMGVSVGVVLLFNALQLFVIEGDVDLTYMSLIIVTFALYQVIYKQDMVFNLKTSGRGEILSNMREMYILTDEFRNVIEVSELLQKKYLVQLSDFIGKPLHDLIEYLEQFIVFYKEYEADTVANPNKDHFHLREKQFVLKGMKSFGYMILLYDETKVFDLLRELNRLSNYDSMTGLNNRNYIEFKLEHLNKTKGVGVISLDLNGLKTNNDYLGHERGDYLLKKLANKIKLVMSGVTDKDMARIGGDEFLILVYNTNLKQLQEYKKQLLEECKSDQIEEHVSVSIGVSYAEEETNIYQLIQEADEDMYEMKRGMSKEYSKQIVIYAEKLDKYIR